MFRGRNIVVLLDRSPSRRRAAILAPRINLAADCACLLVADCAHRHVLVRLLRQPAAKKSPRRSGARSACREGPASSRQGRGQLAVSGGETERSLCPELEGTLGNARQHPGTDGLATTGTRPMCSALPPGLSSARYRP